MTKKSNQQIFNRLVSFQANHFQLELGVDRLTIASIPSHSTHSIPDLIFCFFPPSLKGKLSRQTCPVSKYSNSSLNPLHHHHHHSSKRLMSSSNRTNHRSSMLKWSPNLPEIFVLPTNHPGMPYPWPLLPRCERLDPGCPCFPLPSRSLRMSQVHILRWMFMLWYKNESVQEIAG